MPYVDGFVIAVPKNRLDEYIKVALRCGEIWREHGALEICENVAEDVKPGQLTSFPRAVDLQDGETVVFSWIVYTSRAARDEVNDKVMKDPRMTDMFKPDNMPFDGKRMIYGGFETLIDM